MAEQILDNGEKVYFGQLLEDAEIQFSKKASDWNSIIARKGIDRILIIDDVILGFDNRRLATIEFAKGYGFDKPLTPFKDEWKNFRTLRGKSLRREMHRQAFVDYLAEWEVQAKWSGATKSD